LKQDYNNEEIPKWLRYTLIVIAIAFLIVTCFQIINPDSLHFPFL